MFCPCMVQLLAGIISLRQVRGPKPGPSHGSADTLPLRHSANYFSSLSPAPEINTGNIAPSETTSEAYYLEKMLTYHQWNFVEHLWHGLTTSPSLLMMNMWMCVITRLPSTFRFYGEGSKSPYVNSSVMKIDDITKLDVRFFKSHSNLTGVITEKLWWHLSNMNSILRRTLVFWWLWNT